MGIFNIMLLYFDVFVCILFEYMILKSQVKDQL